MKHRLASQEREVTVWAAGRRLRGTLCAAGSLGPGALLIHGFGSFRDELWGFAELAKRLARKGVTSLRLDMSGCGASEERGYVLPAANWIADSRAGLSALAAMSGVDAARLSVVGMSVGGGVAIALSAIEDQLTRSVALAPVADGRAWLEHVWVSRVGDGAFGAFCNRVMSDRGEYARTGVSAFVDRSEILPGESAELFREYPQMAAQLALCSADDLFAFRPALLADKVKVPTRVVHSLADESVPSEHGKMLHERIPVRKDLLLVDDSPHCFWLGRHAEEVLDATVDWLCEEEA